MKTRQLIRHIADSPQKARRKIVAIAGPPASGKSTLAERLQSEMENSCVVPMDGFHLDNGILEPRGLLSRKGAPDTFDVAGFVALIANAASEPNVSFPLFDRQQDRAIADAGTVGPTVTTVLVEGNYLLFDQPVWRDLMRHWDVTIQLSVPTEELRARLMERWLDHGYTQTEALRKIDENDLSNAKLTQDHALPAQINLSDWAV